MPLQKADRAKTRRFTDGAAWLELRTEVTKGDKDRIQDLNSRTRISAALLDPSGDGYIETLPAAAEINRTLFDILSVAWSLGAGKPTAADYDELEGDSGEWVDECIRQAVTGDDGAAEGNSSRASSNSARRRTSSKRRAPSPTTSPEDSPSSSAPSPTTSAA